MLLELDHCVYHSTLQNIGVAMTLLTSVSSFINSLSEFQITSKLFLQLTLYLLNCQLRNPVVETKYGLIEGTTDGLSRDGRQLYQFRGIQYALVEERFKPSVEPPAWKGIKPAKSFGKPCYDIENHGDENCLFLNVFTESLGSRGGSLRPVAVYLHGGGFEGGAGDNYGPNYLIDEEIVFVTINYRLGVLGFLATGDEYSPGNFGLKDQVMALKWVRDNIAAFGGDKDKVTLMGQSAGGAAVTYHLLSPMSRGLFKYAIAQSGTFLDPWAFTRKPQRYAKKVAELLNCHNTSSTSDIVNCLKKVPARIIAKRQLVKNATLKFYEDPLAGFGPVIEPFIGDGSKTFLSTSPYELLVSGKVAKVPLLAGVVKEEGIFLWASYLLFTKDSKALASRLNLEANFTTVSPAAFYFDEIAPPERLNEVAAKIDQFYFNSKFKLNDNSTFSQLSHLYSDRLFVSSMFHFLNLYSKQAPTYPYIYTFNKFVGIEFGWESLHKKYHLDATHASDLDMLVSPLFGRVRVDPVHDAASKSVTKLWASFMKKGYPSATYGSERNFPAIDPNIGLQSWYRLDIDTETLPNIFAERIKFWERLQLADYNFTHCYC